MEFIPETHIVSGVGGQATDENRRGAITAMGLNRDQVVLMCGLTGYENVIRD